jgi:hypothetical protein
MLRKKSIFVGKGVKFQKNAAMRHNYSAEAQPSGSKLPVHYGL